MEEYALTELAKNYTHVGEYIRKEVLPAGMAVKKAAELLQVSRPNFSNMLQGKTRLTQAMATKIAKAFNPVTDTFLMKLQRAIEEPAVSAGRAATPVQSFARPLKTFSSKDLELFFCTVEGRSRFPEFVRKLIITTNSTIESCDFPGGNDSQIHGEDGIVVATSATPFIPMGRSHWEAGTNEDIKAKADKDYKMRLSLNREERKKTTFVFVTPRYEEGLRKWEEKKRRELEWENVIVIDGPRLVQWTEGSPYVQAWLSEQMGKPMREVFTLEQCWHRWENSFSPRMKPIMHAPQVEAHKPKIGDWLSNANPKILHVTADSADEALAYLYCAFEGIKDWKNRVLVINHPDTLRNYIDDGQNYLYVSSNNECEKLMIPHGKANHFISIRYDSEVSSEAIRLTTIDHKYFTEGLEKIGYAGMDGDALYYRSGGSLTCLRRMLCPNSNIEIKMPWWARERKTARLIIAAALLGICNKTSEKEVDAWRELCNYDNKEEMWDEISNLMQHDDSPLWQFGDCVGVKSKFDAISCTKKHLTQEIEKKFYALSIEVLKAERYINPISLESFNPKPYSEAFKNSICDSLVLLDENIKTWQIPINTKSENIKIFNSCFPSFDKQVVGGNIKLLPNLAEAAPDHFLSKLETDISSGGDKVSLLSFYKNEKDSLFSASCTHEVNWALQKLAWFPRYIKKCTELLTRLAVLNSKERPDDSNIFLDTLNGIFFPELPQTTASPENRVQLMKIIEGISQDIAVKVCFYQFPTEYGMYFPHSKPRWRRFEQNLNVSVTGHDAWVCWIDAYHRLLSYKNKDIVFWRKFFKILPCFEISLNKEIWKSFVSWVECQDDLKKLEVMLEIHEYASPRYSKWRKARHITRAQLLKICKIAEPHDIVVRNRYLFDNLWASHFFQDAKGNYIRNIDYCNKARSKAINLIIKQKGIDGIIHLLNIASDSILVGSTLISTKSIRLELNDILIIQSKVEQEKHFCDFLLGVTGSLSINGLIKLCKSIYSSHLSWQKRLALYLTMPLRRELIQFIQETDNQLLKQFWAKYKLPNFYMDLTALPMYYEYMIHAGRYWAVFLDAIRFSFELTTNQWVTIIEGIINSEQSDTPENMHRISHDLSDILDKLEQDSSITIDQLSRYEFYFQPWLRDTPHGFRCIEHRLASSPEFFIWFWNMRSEVSSQLSHGTLTVTEKDRLEGIRSAVTSILYYWKKSPGDIIQDNTIDYNQLVSWYSTVSAALSDKEDYDYFNYLFGEVLARSTYTTNQIWPCLSVRKFIEKIDSKSFFSGIVTGRFNFLNIRLRPHTEAEVFEKDIRDKSLLDASQIECEFPVTAELLRDIASYFDDSLKRSDELFHPHIRGIY